MRAKQKQSPQMIFDTILYRSQDKFMPFLTASDAAKEGIQKLLENGLVQEGGFLETYDCGCPDTDEADFIEWDQKDGIVRPHIHCRYCGNTWLEEDDIRTWQIQISVLVRMIGEALGLSASPVEVIPEIVWQLGRKNRRDIYYVRRFYKNEMLVRPFFVSHPAAVILVPLKAYQESFRILGLENPCLWVQDVISMNNDFRLTADLSKEMIPFAGETSLRPRVKRGIRAANIEKLIAELKEHYRASKDSYYETGMLLPKPTQEEIAKRVGIGQRAVSRCLADPDAATLQFLWKEIENIKTVLQYG